VSNKVTPLLDCGLDQKNTFLSIDGRSVATSETHRAVPDRGHMKDRSIRALVSALQFSRGLSINRLSPQFNFVAEGHASRTSGIA
jgi:hypothetical protein